jgi:hypothetical protein
MTDITPHKKKYYLFLTSLVLIYVYVCLTPSGSFIEHDDWDFILNGGQILSTKILLNDGRPLTYAWSYISPHILTPTVALIGYWLLFSYISLRYAEILIPRSSIGIFCLVAIILSNASIISLSGWPSISVAGLVLTSIGVSLISIAPISAYITRSFLVALFAFLAFLAYPALSFVILLVGISEQQQKKSLVSIVISFFIGILPFSIWTLINNLNYGNSSEFIYHPFNPKNYSQILSTISLWVLPKKTPEEVRIILFSVLEDFFG